MKNYADLTREQRIQKAMDNRKNDCVLVLDNLTEDNNISAIMRTAEGFGIGRVFIIDSEKKPHLSKNTSKGAIQWLNIEYFESSKECLERLKSEGFQIIGALVDPKAKVLWEKEMEGKVAIVVGNEANGISEVTQNLVDENIYLPMTGLTESLNVSVAAGIFLYELIRQKENPKS